MASFGGASKRNGVLWLRCAVTSRRGRNPRCRTAKRLLRLLRLLRPSQGARSAPPPQDGFAVPWYRGNTRNTRNIGSLMRHICYVPAILLRLGGR
jgi:hypothetical protein